MSLAVLFPGQGSQQVGMGRELARAFPEARAAFVEADEILGFPLSRVAWEGPEDELTRTDNAQAALLVHSVAAWRVARAKGLVAAFAAGHSLGEYSAHVAAGSLDYPDALRLVRRRGELMAAAGRETEGTMAAILGLDGAAVEELCAAVRARGAGTVVPANFNSPGQVVISGEIPAVLAAMDEATARGARRAVRLPVSGAFHSPLMAPAARGLAEALAGVRLQNAALPVVANVDAQPVAEASEIRDRLGRQLLAAVRWEESMRHLLAAGVTSFVELGSGRVLLGLLRQIDRGARGAHVGDPASLEDALQTLAAGAGA